MANRVLSWLLPRKNCLPDVIFFFFFAKPLNASSEFQMKEVLGYAAALNLPATGLRQVWDFQHLWLAVFGLLRPSRQADVDRVDAGTSLT